MKHLKQAACLVLAAAFTATGCIPEHMFWGGGLGGLGVRGGDDEFRLNH